MKHTVAEAAAPYPPLTLHIAGRVVGAEERDTSIVVNPADERALTALPHATAADLTEALEASVRGFTRWRATPPAIRGQILHRAAALVRERSEILAQWAALEMGKPLLEARIEAELAAATLEWYAEEARRAYGRVIPKGPGMRTLVTREPVGPVAAFSPWNFPLVIPARKMGGALAAGCSIIIKPAEESPASALGLAAALYEAGVPGEALQVVFGTPPDISSTLLRSALIRKLSFTGSARVGRELAKLAAERSIRTTLELGGHAPILVFDDADLGTALDLTVAGKYRNAGQVCVSPTRFYVQEALYERFVKDYAERARALSVGNPLDANTRMGPLAHGRRPQAVGALVEEALMRGAGAVTGGAPIEGPGLFWQPTVLRDVPSEARIMNEEPFGPVATMTPFARFEDALLEANRLPYGLAAYAFTRSAARSAAVSEALEAGMVGINTLGINAVEAPFGGVKGSGHGSEGGTEGLDAYLVTKQVSEQWSSAL